MISIKTEIQYDGNPAELSLYLWEDSQEYQTGIRRPMILVCPGGAYTHYSDREGQAIALQFLAMGYHAAILKYSLKPVRYPVQLRQVAAAVRLCREKADEWMIDRDRICVCGFSAGGNLAAMFGTLWHDPCHAEAVGTTPEEIRPNALILGYAVLTEGTHEHPGSWKNLLGEDRIAEKTALSPDNNVSEHTPPCFVWHTGEDRTVPVEGSLSFARALQQNGVPYDLHIYQRGPHGMALGTPLTERREGQVNPAAAMWVEQAHLWLKQLWQLPY